MRQSSPVVLLDQRGECTDVVAPLAHLHWPAVAGGVRIAMSCVVEHHAALDVPLH